jgi:uncharacterized low-complexity protein
MRKNSTPSIPGGVVALAALTLSVAACRNERRVEPTGTAVQPEVARTSIAEARCAYEQRCERIGEGKAYADRGACLSGVLGAWREELAFPRCERGVDAAALRGCLSALREAPCDVGLDKMSTLAACKPEVLCKP